MSLKELHGKPGVFCDMAGRQFGRYVALTCAGKNKHGSYLWNCRCACGTEKVVEGSLLRLGRIVSCGCFNSDNKREIARKRREAGLCRGTGFRMLINEYKGGAIDRGYVWSLTEDFVAELTKRRCDYCGCEPRFVYRAHHGHGAEWVYNGIDRVDNTQGYEPDNVVPCCKTCNLMKGRLSRPEFLAAVAAVTQHQVSPNL